MPVTEDLRTRYQLPQHLDGPAVAAAVAAVLACWRRSRARLKYRAVIVQLEAGYLMHQPLLDEAAHGDPRRLRAALEEHGRLAESERARLRAAVEEAAGGLGLLAESTLAKIATAHRVGEDRVRELVSELGVRVTEPDSLPESVPHLAYARCAGHLEVLRLRHLADFLATGVPGGRTDRPVGVFGAPPVDRRTFEAAAHAWGRLPHGSAQTAAQAVIAALREVLAEQGPEGAARILRHELAVLLRRRRDARATPATLLAYAVEELSIAEYDARRLVFAVLHEAAGDPVADRLRRLAADGRLVEAAAVAERIPADSLSEAVRALVEHMRGELDAAHALLDRARRLPSAEADQAWDLLERAEAAVLDLPGIDSVRRGLAVHPVSGLTAVPDKAHIVLRWRPSPSRAGEPEYVLLRAERHPPLGAAEGTVLPLASPRDTLYVDESPPAGVPLYYAVAVRRAAEPAGTPAPLVVCGPVVHWPEVSDVRLHPGDGEITAGWICSHRAESVEVVRTGPDGAEVRVAARPDGFTDRGLANATTYRYRVRVAYRADNGRLDHTDGLWFSAAPSAPPEPVTDLDIRLVDGGLLACFDRPPGGKVRLYGFDDAPPWTVGTRLRTAELPGSPITTHHTRDGLRFRPPDRPIVVLAVTVAGDRAVIGAHAAVTAQRVGALAVTRHGGTGLAVVFDWPPDSGSEIEVTWRTSGDAGERRRSITRASYRNEAGVRLPVPDGAGVEIEVRAVALLGDLRAYGPPSRLVLPPRADVDYRLERHGLLRRRTVTAVFTARTTVRAQRLLLVRSRDPVWPLEPADGDVLAEAADVTLGPGREAKLSADLARGPDGWLRCFAFGEALVLRDPPQHTLKAT
ncbi:hypothetical protein ABGB12_34035 [Actinocorallia sp. B10E7]|uniref:hypothetical protein n=1 Tax=Actinocorallia sp. B10E7 TaxID=3153558 RepID=UPI00325C5A83